MALFTFDLETSVDCKIDGQKQASPHYAGNNVVLAGWKQGLHGDVPQGSGEGLIDGLADVLADCAVTLCGFNIGFDLAYMLRYPRFRQVLVENMANVRVWDVQQAQYLISGQTMTYPSLNAVCELWGLPMKPDKIKGYWDVGMRTEDISKDELAEYVAHDVSVTAHLAKIQADSMSDEMKALCYVKGDDILCTTMMEHVGMNFNMALCGEIADEIQLEVTKCLDKLHYIVKGNTGYEHFQPTKLAECLTFLYGGTFTWNTKVEDGVYKSGLKKGQVKLKNQEQTIKWDGILGNEARKLGLEKYQDSLTDKVLTFLLFAEDPRNIDAGIFLGELAMFRELNKDLSTYYLGYSKLCWEDGTIKPSFQHCSTVTGRLSCTKPNLQNTSTKDS
jgi:DNA polymerase I-like protein with 3'-5' exonuclease and polymerase domains